MKSHTEQYEYKSDHSTTVLTEIYTLTGKRLGDGAFAYVEEAILNHSSKKVALKRIQPRTRKTTGMFWNEVSALKIISHPSVIVMFDFHPDAQYVNMNGEMYCSHVLSLEIMHYGDLFRLISQTGPLEEKYAKKLARQLLSGLEAIHREGFCHRDVKLENILIDYDFNLKIADFGHSKKFNPETQSSECFTECGTPTFLAPEVLFRNKHTPYDGTKVDVWNAGVVCFIMIVGVIPFCMDKPSDWWFNKLKTHNYDIFWNAHCNLNMNGRKQISELGKQFLNNCFEVDPCLRSSAADLLEDVWFSSTVDDLNDADFLVAFTKEMSNRIEILDVL
mmetsp:Transcript_15875/g.20997  ORF Transcript_15875/g.20997 Transcript_15875/m.20997 type:complete len:333 (+) Transcript_15875:209-1207(+)|eukprot:CAMPEP_0117755692 /NCGR_PEP_ID=MMETSP0947-20121206/13603_1 /TAXON_ID=44440 /ORGANISM="Chattonella subsalsa, Strain CCMP2191" /LENGTH=332 /DNA_ID=CAMNT_0005575075 /DNA_START=172 /DNA_END=1170 /DNA_ORIENTATION=+